LTRQAGEITFYRNGASLGVAFKAVRRQATVAYFPAISLSHGERCELNFGSRPFLYPVPNFRPLQRPPTGAALRIAPYLSNCLSRLVCLRAGVATRSTISDVTNAETVKTSSSVVRCLLSGEDAMLVAAVVAKHLGPLLLDEYVVYAALLPVLLTLRPRPRAPAPVTHLCAQVLDA
jgi:Kip1 ubiquitination-promoting complex protein 1